MDPLFKAYLIERKRAMKAELKWIETTLDEEKQSETLPRFLQPHKPSGEAFLTSSVVGSKMK